MFRGSVFLFILWSFVAALPAQAGLLFDLEGTYIQEQVTASVSTTDARTLLGASGYLSLNNRDEYFLGVGYLDFSSVQTTSAGSTYLTGQDLMLMARWVIGRSRLFHLVAGYGPFAKGGFREAGQTTAELWTGTSLYARLMMAPEISPGLYFGFAVTYYAQSISKREVSHTTSAVSYSTSHVLPSVSLTYLWGR